MVRYISAAILAILVTSATSTGVLLPLYVYPSAEKGDNAANWQPALKAISAQPKTPWLVVANPDNGPGDTLKPGNSDPDYIAAMTQLNKLKNVKSLGYVATFFGFNALDQVKTQIDAWKGWATYKKSNIAVSGIFFDEAPSSNLTYMKIVAQYARNSFKNPITVVCNYKVGVPATFYDPCDVVVAWDSALNFSDLPPYKGLTTLKANIPAAKKSKAAVMVSYFTGVDYQNKKANAALLASDINAIHDFGAGWCYFTSGYGSYDNITAAPATVGAVGNAVFKANQR